MPERDAAPRRYPGMVDAGGKQDDDALWQDAPGLTHCADGMAARVRSDGGDHDWHKPRRRSAQPRLDGNARPDPRGDWAGAVPDVASNELNALRQALAMKEQDCLALAKGAGVTFQPGASVWPKRYLKLR